MLKTEALWNAQQWVAITEPIETDLSTLNTQYHVPRRFINYIRNKKGRARFDYDIDCNCGLFIFKILRPNTSKQSERTKITPFVVLLIDNQIITIVQTPNKKIAQVIAENRKNIAASNQQKISLFMLIMDIMFEFNNDYFDRISDLDNLREQLERYKTNPSNEQILRLSELNKSMIYLKAAASGNFIAAGQLLTVADASDYEKLLTKRERYWLRNLQTEFQQTRELAQVNGEIVQQVTDTYAKLLDKNLNTTMWIMTIWSLALGIPPIISGFYGMNVKLPIIGGWFDWPLSILLSLIPAATLIWALRRKRNLSVKDL
jgi:magnesium transporter